MSNKATGIILIIGSLLYLISTSFVVGHGLHPLNALITIVIFLFGFVMFFKVMTRLKHCKH